MIKKAQRGLGLPTERLESISFEQSHAQGHDEWLLDEALAETFPASDPIAVTPIRLLRSRPPPRPWAADSTKIVDRDKNAESEALGPPIECTHCHTKIAATVALNFEGADYIYHFCGPQCLQAWHTEGNVHGT